MLQMYGWILFIQMLLFMRCHSMYSQIRVQSSLQEVWESSLNSNQFQKLTGITTVIHAEYRDTSDHEKRSESNEISNDKKIPASNKILLKSFKDLEIIIQKGSRLSRQRILAGSVHSFQLNAHGRFSFTIPLNGKNSPHDIPELLCRLESDLSHQHSW